MIIFNSHDGDLHTRTTASALQRLGAEFTVLDLSAFPINAALSLDFAPERSLEPPRRLTYNGQNIDFRQAGVVWWRRPKPFIPATEITDDDAWRFIYSESHAAFWGTWLTLDVFWINHPSRDEEAAQKVYQLEKAKTAGLRIPRTCVTNNPEHAKRFIEEQGIGKTIYKSFTATERAWRETRLLKLDELDLIDSVRFAPLIFQEYIRAVVDLRITIIGEEIFAAAIHSQETNYKYDFRMTMQDARFEEHKLPDRIGENLLALMQSLGIVYGAIDMRLTPEGEYVFLEVNPSGQWIFVEEKTGMPITDALASKMIKEDKART